MKLPQQIQSLFFIGLLAAAYGCGANKSTSGRGDAAVGDGSISGGSTGTGTTTSLGSGGRGGAGAGGVTTTGGTGVAGASATGTAGTGGTSKTGGATGTGGASKTGGATGTGGASKTGGATGTGGASKTGGVTGTGTGGQVSGGTTGSGSGGSGGAAKLDAGAPDGVADGARAEVGGDSKTPDTALDTESSTPDAPADAPMDTYRADTSNGMSLDSCFAGLPAQDGVQQIATKSSSDGRVRMRIDLDTEDRMGTSGTLGWGVIRLAVEVDGVVTCITDRASFTYTGSHHNCTDSATATSGATTYSLTAPDRPNTTLTIQVNGTSMGPTQLTDTACSMMWSPTTPITCRSGGPC